MSLCRRWLFAIIMAISSASVLAQEADSLVLSQVEDILSFDDSLSIFSLIDSLLQNAEVESSQFGVRLAYNSNVLSAGRTLGIENFGLSSGLSYYHKSGFYGDLSGFWSKDFDPMYYLTIASVGYMYSFPKVFSIMAGYDRYFYNTNSDDEYLPYKNTLSVTPLFEVKPFMLSINYSFYFGDTYVNRIMPGLSLVLEKKKLFKIDKVVFQPTFYMLFGDETLTDAQIVLTRQLVRLVPPEWKWTASIEYIDKRVFGIMNYAFTAPLSITHKNWSFMLSYTYNIPKALPGEPLTISESSYLSGSIAYFISTRKNKFPL
jgi:hypothetical protein